MRLAAPEILYSINTEAFIGIKRPEHKDGH
jgi:hypothetical protein